MAVLISVNIAKSRTHPSQSTRTTGIDKRPVRGPVAVRAPGPKGTGATGLAGDRAHDPKHHGGDDQAVYAYAREDLDEWAVELGRELPGGVFGENLTTRGLDVNGALIGERWRVGEQVVLEVALPRIPCGTFQAWMREEGWIKRFTRRAVPGAYLRVIEPGEIQAGDEITVVDRPGHGVTVAITFRALTLEPELLPKLPAADALPEEIKETARKRAT